MNDLAKIKAGSRGLILSSLADMRDAAQLILQSGFAPAGYTKPEQIFVALQSGAELGLPPMHALNSIAIINGKPSLYGDAALALVKKSGLLFEYSEEVTGEGEGMIAKVHSLRIDENDSKMTVDTAFSVADAKQAKLWGKSGPWTTHPKRMLKYKARAFNLRDNFPDVLMGLHITEELIGETAVVESMPAPECDTPGRGEAKKIDATVSDTKPITDPETLGLMLEGCINGFYEKAGLDYGEDDSENYPMFIKFATFILMCDKNEIRDSGDYTFDMLTKLNKALEQPLPLAIVEMLPVKEKDNEKL